MSPQSELGPSASVQFLPISPEYFNSNPQIESKISMVRGEYPHMYNVYEVEIESGLIIGLPGFRETEVKELRVGDDITIEPMRYSGEILAVRIYVSRDEKKVTELSLGLSQIFDSKARAKK